MGPIYPANSPKIEGSHVRGGSNALAKQDLSSTRCCRLLPLCWRQLKLWSAVVSIYDWSLTWLGWLKDNNCNDADSLTSRQTPVTHTNTHTLTHTRTELGQIAIYLHANLPRPKNAAAGYWVCVRVCLWVCVLWVWKVKLSVLAGQTIGSYCHDLGLHFWCCLVLNSDLWARAWAMVCGWGLGLGSVALCWSQFVHNFVIG